LTVESTVQRSNSQDCWTDGFQDPQRSANSQPTVIFVFRVYLMAETTGETISEVETEETKSETDLNLFNVKGVRRPELWQCMKFIAPTVEKKKWLSTEAVGKEKQIR